MSYKNLDRKLINSLLNDGRASLRSLAEELDVSVTTVSNHLQGLQEAGIIEGYNPRVNYEARGYDVTAVIQLKVEGGSLPDITDQLESQERMISVYEVTGDYDIVTVGKFTDTDGMNQQIKEILSDVDIRESNTSVVLNSVSDHAQFELRIDDE